MYTKTRGWLLQKFHTTKSHQPGGAEEGSLGAKTLHAVAAAFSFFDERTSMLDPTPEPNHKRTANRERKGAVQSVHDNCRYP